MGEELHITFDGPDRRMTAGEAWTDIENRKEELVDRAEANWFENIDEKDPDKKRLNIRHAIAAQVSGDKPEEIKEAVRKAAADPENVLWEKITTRFPNVEDRDLLLRGYRENFLPEQEELLNKVFDKFDHSRDLGLTKPEEQAEYARLLKEVTSTRKLIEYLDYFEAARKEAEKARAEREDSKRYSAEKKTASQERAQELMDDFMTKEVNIGPAKTENIADIAARIGAGLEKNKNEPISSEEWESIKRAASTIVRGVVEISYELRDQTLMVQKIGEAADKAFAEFKRAEARNVLHEKTTEQLTEEQRLYKTFL